MKQIKTLTDKEILGLEGLSEAKPRLTARAIVRNDDGNYAVMYSKKYDLYSLPGGGVEEGEDVLTALRREVLEETGCVCRKIRELGVVTENRGTLDYTQVNYYYVADACREGDSSLTEAELACSTEVQWHSFEDLVRLIASQSFERVQGKYLVARDKAALDEYKSRI